MESIRYYANNLPTGLPAGTLGSAVRTNGIAGNQHIALPRRLNPRFHSESTVQHLQLSGTHQSHHWLLQKAQISLSPQGTGSVRT